MSKTVTITPVIAAGGNIELVDIVIHGGTNINSRECNYWYDNCRTIISDMYGATLEGLLTDPYVTNDSEDGSDYIIMSLYSE